MSGNAPATQPIVEISAGFSAGVASTLVSHPLDLLKVRLQVRQNASNQFNQSLRTARHIYSREGGVAAFYRGLVPNLLGNSLSWASYFLLYNGAKEILAGPANAKALTYSDFLLASSSAGLLTAVISNPIWVVKTRMLSTPVSHAGAYSSVLQGVRRILAEEGVRGFYAGLVPSLIGVTHGSLQFVAYEELRRKRSRQLTDRGQQLQSVDFLLLGGFSKVIAGTLTFPYQVIRTRLKEYGAQRVYRGLWDAVRITWTAEGLRGFYRGLTPNLIRVMPSSAVTFLVYEQVKALSSRGAHSSGT